MIKCPRCKEESTGSIMSMFNTETICFGCKEKERAHPKYKEAQEAERREVQQGNRNFRGIGKPSDL
jgi:hypothetical protein